MGMLEACPYHRTIAGVMSGLRRAHTAPGIISWFILKQFSKKYLTWEECTEHKSLELSSGEWENQQGNEASLDSEEDALTVATEGEVVPEAVGATEGDRDQLQEDTGEADTLSTATGRDLEDLGQLDQAWSHHNT